MYHEQTSTWVEDDAHEELEEAAPLLCLCEPDYPTQEESQEMEPLLCPDEPGFPYWGP